jgi:hypothetical protein
MGRPFILEVIPGQDGMHERRPWIGTAAIAAARNVQREEALAAHQAGARVLPLYWWGNGPIRGELVQEPAASVADEGGAEALHTHLANELAEALRAIPSRRGRPVRVQREPAGEGRYVYRCAGTHGRYVVAEGTGGRRFIVRDGDGHELATVTTLAEAMRTAYGAPNPTGNGSDLQLSGDVLQ